MKIQIELATLHSRLEKHQVADLVAEDRGYFEILAGINLTDPRIMFHKDRSGCQIWINLAVLCGGKGDDDYTEVHQTLHSVFKAYKFSNLSYNDCGYGSIPYFDEFIPEYNIETMAEDLAYIRSDLLDLSRLLDEFQAIPPKRWALVREEK